MVSHPGRTAWARLASAALMILCVSSAGAAETHRLVRVPMPRGNRLGPLAGFDIAGTADRGRFLDLLVTAPEWEKLRSLGYEAVVVDEDPGRTLRKLASKADLGLYHTYAETEAALGQLEAAYPALAEVVDLGLSVEGRHVWGLRISDNVLLDEGEPEVLVVGNHHAREIMTVEVPLSLAEHLLANYASDPAIQALVDGRLIYVVPMLNPDGHVYVENVDSYWRKNRRLNGDGTYGVDLNRNYGFQWGYDDEGSSPTPSDETYRGTGAFSEPEAAAIRTLAESRDFVLTLSMHSYGKLVLLPWGYVAEDTPDHEVFVALAEIMASGPGYAAGNGADGLIYATNGSSDDYLYGEQSTKPMAYAFTYEMNSESEGGFSPDESLIAPTCAALLPGILQALELADTPERALPPKPPEVLEAGAAVPSTFEVAWITPAPEPANPAVSYDLYESTGPSLITQSFETEPGYALQGFFRQTTRKHEGSYALRGGNVASADHKASLPFALAASVSDTLRFWTYYSLELNWDYAWAEASADGGQHWTTLAGNRTTTYNPNGSNPGNAMTGSSGGWVLARFPLGSFAGQDILIRLRARTDGYVTNEGFYVDEVYPEQAFAASARVLEAWPDTSAVMAERASGEYYYHAVATDAQGQDSGPGRRAVRVVNDLLAAEEAVAPVPRLAVSPNPFHAGAALLSGRVPGAARDISVRVYATDGRMVRTLETRADGAGSFALAWDGRDGGGHTVASGLYVAEVRAGAWRAVARVVLLR